MVGQIGDKGLALAAAVAIGATAPAWGHGPIERVSVGPGGLQSNGGSSEKPAISLGGRFVAFASDASNLVPGDTNGAADIFVRDRRAGQTTRVSVSSRGAQGNAPSTQAEISANGRFVAFRSDASNLVPGDTNGAQDVFIHDRRTSKTTRVSVSSRGAQSGGVSCCAPPGISANGRFVVFESEASDLVADDTNGVSDVFVHDRRFGRTERVSVSSRGAQANASSGDKWISADGRFVSFHSQASNLVPGDTNGVDDVFVHDRWTGRTTRVSVTSHGAQANGISWWVLISGNGRFVGFSSWASNLVPGDTNGVLDVFVYDRRTGKTTRVSVSSRGSQANGDSFAHALSADGRFVAFDSNADNLVPGDTNGTGDVFVHDRHTGRTTRVSVGLGHAQTDGISMQPALSPGGRFMVFHSEATNLVPGDTNGVSDVFVRALAPATAP
jgi:Tol biopolymer transport system component